MGFIDSVKQEILTKNLKDKHCRKAFIAGVIRGAGTLFEADGNLGLEIRTNNEEVAMYVTTAIKNIFDCDIREVSVSEDRLNNKDKFVMSIYGEEAIKILTELEILTESAEEFTVNLNFYGAITQKECCLKAFVRGLFLVTGNCIVPKEKSRSSGYHLEIAFSHYTPAHETAEQLAQFNVMTKITRRRDGYILYIKSAEEIKDFLAFLPAPISVLKLMELMINRELSNNSNRQKNCDLGNVNKQVEASAKQIEAIEKIKETIGLDALKVSDREVAKAREENPDETLLELAQRLNISKSCLNHRLRKIVSIANEL